MTEKPFEVKEKADVHVSFNIILQNSSVIKISTSVTTFKDFTFQSNLEVQQYIPVSFRNSSPN